MAPRKGTRTKLGRRKRPRNRLEELTERARQEGRSLTRRGRRERRRDMRARTESVEISPNVTRSLLFVLQLIASPASHRDVGGMAPGLRAES